MTEPNSRQLADAHATDGFPSWGAHSRCSGWRSRIAYYGLERRSRRSSHRALSGMHGLQVLPLLAWWIGRRRVPAVERTQRNLIFAAATSYLRFSDLFCGRPSAVSRLHSRMV